VAAGGLGVAVIALGSRIKHMGQEAQGNIVIIGGTMITAAAVIAYLAESDYQGKLDAQVRDATAKYLGVAPD
jgi:hypothetical protein